MNDMLTTETAVWRVWGASIQGTQHKRKNIPNQDAIQWSDSEVDNEPIIVAISDGHGSSASFRSARGAEIAVAVACQALTEFVTEVEKMKLEVVDAQLQATLLPHLIKDWETKVQEDFYNNPLTEDDLKLKNGTSAQKEFDLTNEEIQLAYGATLLVVCISSTYVIYFQLGDGEILIVDELETVSSPLPEDSELIANETHSLCSRNALEKIRYDIVSLEKQNPLIILMCSDGYSNAFESRSAFFELGSDYLKLHRTEGLESLKELIPSFLEEASSLASGDDVTLGLIKRVEHFDIDTLWDELKGLRQLYIESKILSKTNETLLQSHIKKITTIFWVVTLLQVVLFGTIFLYSLVAK
jgi:serine/threonine protein phosphatase PrpC